MQAKLLSGNSGLALCHRGRQTEMDAQAQCDLNTDLVLRKISAQQLLSHAGLGCLEPQ